MGWTVRNQSWTITQEIGRGMAPWKWEWEEGHVGCGKGLPRDTALSVTSTT